MKELKNDPFYDRINKYPDIVPGYYLLTSDGPHRGESSHREALLFAMKDISSSPEGGVWDYDIDDAVCRRVGNDFLSLPDELAEKAGEDPDSRCDTSYMTSVSEGGIPYWQAFLLPPQGPSMTYRDFYDVNSLLFPEGTEELEIYDWSSDWSEYFDEGREWWGTLCVTVYDKALDRYAVILASATD